MPADFRARGERGNAILDPLVCISEVGVRDVRGQPNPP
jgi:hypothetical protein